MINIDKWLAEFQRRLLALFGGRLIFFGIQGSYARGEATDASDIDVVVLLDKMNMVDLRQYRRLLDESEHRELVCGFVGGVQELAAWEPSELFQFCHDTKALAGSIEDILAHLPGDAAHRAASSGACAIYHGCSHNYLHGRSSEALRELYKGALFVLRAKHYCEHGVFIANSKDLLAALSGTDREILRLRNEFISGDITAEVEKHTEKLLLWAQEIIVAEGGLT